MDPSFYHAAMGTNAFFIVSQNIQELERQITPKHNTVLHVAALFGNTNFVQKAVAQCPSLLCKVNIRNETALHIAAKEGRVDVANALIEGAKSVQEEPESGVKMDRKMLRMTDKDEDTALHKAVRNCHRQVVKLLVKADPEFLFPPNKLGETPLYLAAEGGCEVCLLEILNSCASPNYSGPGGRTALHAAVVFKHQGTSSLL